MKCLWSSLGKASILVVFLEYSYKLLNFRGTTCKHLTCKSELLKSCPFEKLQLHLVKSRNLSLHPALLFLYSDMEK